MIDSELARGVQATVGPLLAELGFVVDEYVDKVNEGGPQWSVVIYRAIDCKIQIYQSARSGEINCMIAPVDAPNVFGLYDKSGKWQYLPRFAIRQGASIDEINKYSPAVDLSTIGQFLESVRSRIEKYLPVAHAGVLEMVGPEWWASK